MCLAHSWCPASLCFLRSPRSCLQEREGWLGGSILTGQGSRLPSGGQIEGVGGKRVKMEPGQARETGRRGEPGWGQPGWVQRGQSWGKGFWNTEGLLVCSKAQYLSVREGQLSFCVILRRSLHFSEARCHMLCNGDEDMPPKVGEWSPILGSVGYVESAG